MCCETQLVERAGLENRAQGQRCLLGDPEGEQEEGIGFAATSCPMKNDCKTETSETQGGKVQEAEGKVVVRSSCS